MKGKRTAEPLTRAELAQSAGISKSKVRRMQAAGEIESVVNEKGVHLFRIEDVEHLIGDRPIVRLDQARCHVPSAADSGGDLAAKIYERLDRNVLPNDIVRELRVHPDVVDGFVARWRRWSKAIILTTAAIEALAQAIGIRPTRNVEHLVEWTRAALEKRSQRGRCRNCKKTQGKLCNACVIARTHDTEDRLRERFGLPARQLSAPPPPTDPDESADDDGDSDDDNDE